VAASAGRLDAILQEAKEESDMAKLANGVNGTHIF
jgi:hypothetical protein